MKPKRIGILGGMGPLAGVELQRLIVEATPAQRDQDHLEVVCYTAPFIPDRTDSLKQDGGSQFVTGVVQACRTLVLAQVDTIVMACHTAHARLAVIQQQVPVPLFDMVQSTADHLQAHYPQQRIVLLATEGTITSGVYSDILGIDWIVPSPAEQSTLMDIIYTIKAGRPDWNRNVLVSLLRSLQDQGGSAFLLGCTELSLYYDFLVEQGFSVIDPLRIAAQQIVDQIREGA